jgi:thiol-disulfide isomerase/thioredoxin
VIAGGLLFAGSRDQGPEANAASAQVKDEGTRPLGVPEKQQVTLPPGADAAAVYLALTQEIRTLTEQAMSTGNAETQARAFGDVEAKLLAFREQYPGTPEANDAAFQLGTMSFGTQRHEQAHQYLVEYLAKADESQHDQVGYARFYLAEVYRAQGKYDAAEGEYKLVLSKYREVNPKMTQIAQTNLGGLNAERMVAVGSEPVAFSVKSLDGQTLSPAAYKGKVLLIDFWATWCGPCIMEMPNVKSVYSRYHSKGFEIVGISLDQSREKLDAYLEQQQIEWPQYFDGKWWNNDVAVKYGIRSIPTTVLVDKKGKIRYKTLRGKQLETAVQQLLNEEV